MPFGPAARSPRVRHFASLLARTTARGLPSEEVVHLAVGLVARVMRTDVASMYTHDDGAGELVLAATHGLSRSAVGHVTLRVGEGMSGRAAQTRQPVAAADVAADPTFRLITAFDQSQYKSLLAVPMLSGDELIGTVNVQTLDVHHYEAGEIEDLLGVAQVLAPTVAALWREDLAARLRGPSAAARLEAAMAATVTDTELCHVLVRELRMLFPFHTIGVTLRAPERGRLTAGTFTTPVAPDGSVPLDGGQARASTVVRLSGKDDVRGAIVLSPLGAAVSPLSRSAIRVVETLGAQMLHALELRARQTGEHAAAEPASALESLVRAVLDDLGLDAVLARAEDICDCRLAITDAGGLPIAGSVPSQVTSNLALRVAGTVVGRLLAPTDVESTPALNAAADALALELSKWQNRFEVERTLRAEGLDVLLAAQGDERELGARARALGIDLSRPYVPIVFAFDVEAFAAARGPLALAALSRLLQRSFGADDSSACFVRADGLLLLAESADPPRIAMRAKWAVDEVRRAAPGVGVAAGTAGPVLHVRDYADAVRQAAVAASLAMHWGSAEPLDAADLGVDRIFVQVPDRSHLQAFADREIGALLIHDATQGTELVRTLEAHYLSGEKLRVGAAAVFVHVNTMKYRLDRIAELTGRDLRNPSDRFILYCAIHAHRFLNPSAPSLLSSTQSLVDVPLQRVERWQRRTAD